MKLGQVENKPQGKGDKTLFLSAGILVLLVIVAAISHRGAFHLHLPQFGGAAESTGSIPADQLPQYEEFAKKVAISICNIGFHNVQSYLDDNSQYFTQNIMYDFQNSFFTPDLQHQIVDQKLYCTAQNIQAIQRKIVGDEVGYWFTGVMEYTTAINNSSIQIPFSFRLVVKKFQDGFKVTGFYLMTDQK